MLKNKCNLKEIIYFFLVSKIELRLYKYLLALPAIDLDYLKLRKCKNCVCKTFLCLLEGFNMFCTLLCVFYRMQYAARTLHIVHLHIRERYNKLIYWKYCFCNWTIYCSHITIYHKKELVKKECNGVHKE